jgi:hypothetical protein
MKKNILAILFITFLIFVLIPVGHAWKWDTHASIVEETYYALPPEVQANLSLDALRDGSNDPDEEFHDFRSHSFTSSYYKAINWLDKGKYAYQQGNYYDASYCFGVASHYISDTFSAPHCTHDESSSLHTQYEAQGNSLKPHISYNDTDLYAMMSTGYQQGQLSWQNWIATDNSIIVQNNLDNATTASYSAIKSWITT